MKSRLIGCSDFKERYEELKKNHEEFLKMVENGFQIKSVRPKRPRIKEKKNPKAVVVTLGGEWTVTLSFDDYKKRGEGLKVVMKIY